MIDKLERWAWWGGALLAGNAGMVNAVGLQSYAHQAVTHVTGTSSLLTLSGAQGAWSESLKLAFVLLAFLAGAALSGFIIQNASLRLGRRYGVALLIESILLVAAAVMMRAQNPAGSYLASAAFGLQNAMASTYSGAVLRTTHLSGMYTDVGAALGHFARGGPVDWLRFRLYTFLIGSFLLGGIAGSLLFARFSYNTLFFPAFFTGAVAIIYTVYVQWRRPRTRTPG